MDCRKCNKLLPLYLDASLSSHKMADLKRHLQDCDACRQESELYFRAVSLVGQVDAVDVPVDFHQRFMFRWEREKTGTRPVPVWNMMVFASAGAAVVLLLSLLVYNPVPEWLKRVPMQNASTDTPAAVAVVPTGPETVVESTDTPMDEILALSDMGRLAAFATPAVTADATLPQQIIVGDRYAAGSALLEAPAPAAAYRSQANPLIKTVASVPVFASEAKKPSFAGVNLAAAATPPPLVRQGREWSGEHCAITAPLTTMARTQPELEQLWTRARITSTSMPQLDWSSQMLGAIFLGDRPGQGYVIELKQNAEQNGVLTQHYQVAAPAEPSGDKTTRPFLLFTLPQSELPVHFIED